MSCKALFLGARGAALVLVLLCASFLVDRASGEQLTIADLTGVSVDAFMVTSQTVRSSRGVSTHRVTYAHTLQIAPKDNLKYTLTIKTSMLDGTTRSRTWTANVVIGKPHQFRDGQAVWILEDGALVHLRTGTEGGATVRIALEGSRGNLTCKATRAIAKEVGVGKMTSSQTASGHKIDVLKQTDISSSCRVRSQT